MKVARLKGLEPPAHCLEGSCSIQLSYRRNFTALPKHANYYIRKSVSVNIKFTKLSQIL